MSIVPASRRLVEFTPLHERHRKDPPQQPAIVSDTVSEQRLRESFERGLAEGKLLGRQEMETALVKQREMLATSFAKERIAWVESQGAALCRDLASGLEGIEQRIADATARIIASFLEEHVRNKAIAVLRGTLQELLGDDGGLTIRGSGPVDLVERLKDSNCCPELARADLEPGGPELSLAISETLIETRIAAWAEGMRQALS